MERGFTKVPNSILDIHLTHLSLAELKVLLVVVRQTIGWAEGKSGKRKAMDRISHTLFVTKTGLSRKILSKTIQSLVSKGLICVSDYEGSPLDTPSKRKGRASLYYSFLGLEPVQMKASTCAQTSLTPVQKRTYNKRNYLKRNKTKEMTEHSRMKPLSEILETLFGKHKKDN